MDRQTIGCCFLAMGLILVVAAGYFLRRRPSGAEAESVGGKQRLEPVEKRLWVWIGRAGALLSMVGAMLVVLAGR